MIFFIFVVNWNNLVEKLTESYVVQLWLRHQIFSKPMVPAGEFEVFPELVVGVEMAADGCTRAEFTQMGSNWWQGVNLLSVDVTVKGLSMM